jgi:hypothetical protein
MDLNNFLDLKVLLIMSVCGEIQQNKKCHLLYSLIEGPDFGDY